MTTIDPLSHKPTEDYIAGKKPLAPEGNYADMTISNIEPYELDPEKEFNQAKLEKGYTHRVIFTFVSDDGEKEIDIPMNWGPTTTSTKLPVYRLQKAVFGDNPENWGGLGALQGQKVHVYVEHETFGKSEYVSPKFTPVS